MSPLDVHDTGAGRPAVLREDGDPRVLWVSGSVIARTALGLLRRLELAVAGRPAGLVVLDLSRVWEMDVLGLDVLTEFRARQNEEGGDVALRSVPPSVGALLLSAGQSDLFASAPRRRPRTAHGRRRHEPLSARLGAARPDGPDGPDAPA